MMRIAGVLLICVIAAGPSLGDDLLATADDLRSTGRYEEAIEQYQHLAQAHPAAAMLGIVRCEVAIGREAAAQKRLEQGIAEGEEAPDFHAELARLHFTRGRYEQATQHCNKAIAIDDDQLLARWIQAELHRVTGKLNEAEEGYAWLVDHYNNTEKIDDPQAIRIIGLAAAQKARWKRDSEQFKFLVSHLYPEALSLDENYWPAHLEMGRLFLEKYNQREATRQFNAALAINPNAAEVHAARAELALQSFDLDRAAVGIERALEINPNLLHAHLLKADWLMAGFRVNEAIDVLEDARSLQPRSEQALGRLAAGYAYVDGADSISKDDTRLAAVVREVEQFNPHCGRFYETMGDTLDLLRKYPASAIAFERAHERMPQLIGVPGKLGLVKMRLGDEAIAREQLEHSFEIDPFNVRVKNSLEVLDVLDNYALIETEHFVIKFDRGQDQMLAEYAAEYLESEVYPQIVKELGYEPKEKSLFEIFSRAKNTSGHGWFSARMVGLPYIGTVGACAGQMVAIASPNDMPQPYNWARVLKHEFVHVVNLQQTNFNIPHWFTEALAVRSEGFPRPTEWTRLLAKRQAEETLFTLDDINHGFLRPGAGDDWTLAYCQAEIYAEYMVHRFGEESLAKMLVAYRDNFSTREAISRCFDLTQEDFEQGYREYVATLVENVQASSTAKSLPELQKTAEEEPDNAKALAELSFALLQRKSNTDARRYAKAALTIDPQQQLAAYVMARLYLSIGDTAAAVKYLRDSFQEASLQPNHLALLAGILLRAEKNDEAERLFELGARSFPHDEAWLKRLASVYLQTGDKEKLEKVLKQLSQLTTDSVAIRTKLAQLAMEREDYQQAERWAMQGLHINIKDAKLHALRASALAATNQQDAAAKEYNCALQLNPEQPAWRLALARCYAQADRRDEAKRELTRLLERRPNYLEASELLKELSTD